MAAPFDPGSSSRVVRLFPLPDVVLFPHTVLPLHIFEPRYRQMTEDALARDKAIALVRVKTGPSATAIEDVGCLGEIVQHQRLADGRFDILLAGRRRVRLGREVPSEKLYRVAEADVLEDEYPDVTLEHHRTELLAVCRATLEASAPDDADLSWLWSRELPLGVLTDIAASAARLAPETRQALLRECRVEKRVQMLLDALRSPALRSGAEPAAERVFPPRFSAN